MTRLPQGATVRRDAGLYGYERALRRVGMDLVAGVDEAGRGACAGPLVAGAAILKPGKGGEIPGLADSKLLTEQARERCYTQIVKRALSWAVVVIESDECDRLGMHVANIEALRRAVALLDVPPQYVLTDGFPVDGLGRPGLAMWKGDRVAACISAASVLAKVTRDRIMVALDGDHPAYDFKTHKGYVTDVHNAALLEHGPCAQHRMRFVNVRRAAADPRWSSEGPRRSSEGPRRSSEVETTDPRRSSEVETTDPRRSSEGPRRSSEVETTTISVEMTTLRGETA
jgi:ribonuclease HII